MGREARSPPVWAVVPSWTCCGRERGEDRSSPTELADPLLATRGSEEEERGARAVMNKSTPKMRKREGEQG